MKQGGKIPYASIFNDAGHYASRAILERHAYKNPMQPAKNRTYNHFRRMLASFFLCSMRVWITFMVLAFCQGLYPSIFFCTWANSWANNSPHPTTGARGSLWKNLLVPVCWVYRSFARQQGVSGLVGCPVFRWHEDKHLFTLGKERLHMGKKT